MTPREALAVIDGLEKFGIDLSLDRITACLAALDDPQFDYPAVHVAGTNGKGSTCAVAEAILRAAGYRTGLYVSPPLEEFGERIRVNGAFLPEGELPGLFEAVAEVQGRIPAVRGMTQFEVITAMAFLHFARRRVEIAVIEVGLGGRLDSTNVLRPAVTAITNVGLEHAEHLGGTVEAIAAEKAGIARPGVPLITGAGGEALTALSGIARQRGIPLRVWGRDFVVEEERPGLRFRGRRWDLGELHLALSGGYQRRNLGLALALLEVLEETGWTIPEAAVRRGVEEVRWPGRLEVVGAGPRVVLDGAHNPHASAALAQSLREELEYEQLWLVLGILGDKDARSILADLAPLGDRLLVTRSRSARARRPAEIGELIRGLSTVLPEAAPSVAEALDRAIAGAGPADLVCVTGSLTTVGEARAHLRALGWVT